MNGFKPQHAIQLTVPQRHPVSRSCNTRTAACLSRAVCCPLCLIILSNQMSRSAGRHWRFICDSPGQLLHANTADHCSKHDRGPAHSSERERCVALHFQHYLNKSAKLGCEIDFLSLVYFHSSFGFCFRWDTLLLGIITLA